MNAGMPAARSHAGPLLLILILLSGLLLRLNPVLGNVEQQRNGLGPFGDSWAYHVIGYNLAQGVGYSMTDFGGAKGQGTNPTESEFYLPAATRAPLYPAFLASIYKTSGLTGTLTAPQMQRTFHIVRAVQCLLDTITGLLVFLITRTLTPQLRLPAFLSAAIYAASPYHAYFTNAILTETLACFLAAAAVLATSRGMRNASVGAFCMSGMFWGLLSLCRPEYLWLSGAIVAILAVVQFRRSQRMMPILGLLAGILLATGPWMARNHAAFGSPFISVGGMGYSLFLGSFEGRHPPRTWNALPEAAFGDSKTRERADSLVREYLAAMRLGSATIREIDKEFLKLAADRFRTDPIGVASGWLVNLPKLAYQGNRQIYRDPEPPGGYALSCLLLATISAIWFIRRRVLAAVPALAFCALVLLMYLPLHIEPRYGLPMLTIAMSLTGLGATLLLSPAVAWLADRHIWERADSER